jgi:hypothetical protein
MSVSLIPPDPPLEKGGREADLHSGNYKNLLNENLVGEFSEHLNKGEYQGGS